MRVTFQELQERLKLPLFEKIQWTIERYIDYFEAFDGMVYLCFSGGKDSQVLADIIDKLHDGKMDKYLRFEYVVLCKKLIFPDNKPPKVFCDTKLEFPELRKHVNSFENVVYLRPVKMYKDVVKDHGFAIGSKKISRMVSDLRNPTVRNEATRNLYLTGIKKDGTKSKVFMLPKKWQKLVDAPFEVSNKCCDYFKKMPFRDYEKISQRKPIVGTMTEESEFRRVSYLKTGCNNFGKKAQSKPISIWSEVDIWNYAEQEKIRFCKVYYKRVLENGEEIEGETQTGCAICGFGVTQEPKNKKNRYQRLAKTHPKMHNFYIHVAGLKEVLEYIDVPYDNKETEDINLLNHL